MEPINKSKISLRWSKTSYLLLSGFLIILFLIGYVWRPLVKEYLSSFNPGLPIWAQIDWLLVGIFLFMSVMIMLNADLKRDLPIFVIALCGGFIIESWGTQAGLWTYYTNETPPIWIIPAWPIAALTVNRLFSISRYLTKKIPEYWFKWAYGMTFVGFIILLIGFVWPTRSHPLTIFSIVICVLMILVKPEYRSALLVFWVGSALGYFLELWGTTRLCWVYYTGGMPPFFTVLAHGMASLAIWRIYRIYLLWIHQSKAQWLMGILPAEALNEKHRLSD